MSIVSLAGFTKILKWKEISHLKLQIPVCLCVYVCVCVCWESIRLQSTFHTTRNSDFLAWLFPPNDWTQENLPSLNILKYFGSKFSLRLWISLNRCWSIIKLYALLILLLIEIPCVFISVFLCVFISSWFVNCRPLTLSARISQNGQTHSNNSSANFRRIAWVCLTILWDWRLKG